MIMDDIVPQPFYLSHSHSKLHLHSIRYPLLPIQLKEGIKQKNT